MQNEKGFIPQSCDILESLLDKSEERNCKIIDANKDRPYRVIITFS